MKEYLTIGEMADIFNMDVQLLRYYDKQGLLVPALRNTQNKRRFYHFDQIYPLATIRYLRKLGYSLERIGNFVRTEDIDKNVETLTDQAAILRKKCEELMQTVDIIQKKLDFIKQESQFTAEGRFFLRDYPDRQFVHIGDEINLFTHELFYFYPLVGFYSGDGKRFGAYLFEQEQTALPQNTPISEIPGGRYFCGYHYGPYNTIQDSIDHLYQMGSAHHLDNCVVTLNIIDQFAESHPANYITALEVRILD